MRKFIGRTALKAASVILLLAFVLPLLPAPSFAADGMCGDALFWSYRANVLTISGEGDMYDFVQKDSKDGEKTAAPWKRMYGTSIAKVVIEEGCTGVGEYAFYGYAQLGDVSFARSVKKIGKYAFSDCKNLRRVTLPDATEYVGSCAFNGCTSLKYVDFGSAACTVSDNAFYGDTALETLNLSENCRYIGASAFAGCRALGDADLSHLSHIGALAFSDCAFTSVEFGQDLDYCGSSAFAGCSGLTDVIFDDGALPSFVSNAFLDGTPYFDALDVGVYTLFSGKVLMVKGTYGKRSLSIPDGIVSVAAYALDKAKWLSSVSFPESLRSIGEYAFRDCPSLLSVFIPDGVEYIGNGAFGKETEEMSYVNIEGFVIHGHGDGAAADYAWCEVLPYVCDHEFEYTEEFSDCTSGGVRRLVCRFCGACTEREIIPPASHTVSAEWRVLSLPDCAKRGEVARVCTVCGVSVETVYIEKTAHTPSPNFVTVRPARCIEDGYEAVVCLTCGEELSTRTLPATGHKSADEKVALTLPDDSGNLAGCTATVCRYCTAILSVEWKSADGKTSPEAKQNIIDTMNSVMRAEGDAPLSALDFNGDGEFNLKDVFSFRELPENTKEDEE